MPVCAFGQFAVMCWFHWTLQGPFWFSRDRVAGRHFWTPVHPLCLPSVVRRSVPCVRRPFCPRAGSPGGTLAVKRLKRGVGVHWRGSLSPRRSLALDGVPFTGCLSNAGRGCSRPFVRQLWVLWDAGRRGLSPFFSGLLASAELACAGHIQGSGPALPEVQRWHRAGSSRGLS